jgi:hypothetical protein
MARPAMAASSAPLPAPQAWADSPVVPMRRKPNSQYTALNTAAPTATAPM